jgi:hypothetical protein
MMGRLAAWFTRVEPRQEARKYVTGLICDLPRKNYWAWLATASAGHRLLVRRTITPPCGCAVTAALPCPATSTLARLPTAPDNPPPADPGLIPLTVAEIKRVFNLLTRAWQTHPPLPALGPGGGAASHALVLVPCVIDSTHLEAGRDHGPASPAHPRAGHTTGYSPAPPGRRHSQSPGPRAPGAAAPPVGDAPMAGAVRDRRASTSAMRHDHV